MSTVDSNRKESSIELSSVPSTVDRSVVSCSSRYPSHKVSICAFYLLPPTFSDSPVCTFLHRHTRRNALFQNQTSTSTLTGNIIIRSRSHAGSPTYPTFYYGPGGRHTHDPTKHDRSARIPLPLYSRTRHRPRHHHHRLLDRRHLRPLAPHCHALYALMLDLGIYAHPILSSLAPQEATLGFRRHDCDRGALHRSLRWPRGRYRRSLPARANESEVKGWPGVRC